METFGRNTLELMRRDFASRPRVGVPDGDVRFLKMISDLWHLAVGKVLKDREPKLGGAPRSPKPGEERNQKDGASTSRRLSLLKRRYTLNQRQYTSHDMTPRLCVVGLMRCCGAQESCTTPALAAWRSYATHSGKIPPSGSPSGQNATTDSTAELLRRLEAESRRQGGASGFGGSESVGPFPLGVGPSGRRKMWRPWGELGLRGKSGSISMLALSVIVSRYLLCSVEDDTADWKPRCHCHWRRTLCDSRLRTHDRAFRYQLTLRSLFSSCRQDQGKRCCESAKNLSRVRH